MSSARSILSRIRLIGLLVLFWPQLEICLVQRTLYGCVIESLTEKEKCTIFLVMMQRLYRQQTHRYIAIAILP